MFLTFLVGEAGVHGIEASGELSVRDLKAIIAMEAELKGDFGVFFDGNALTDLEKTLAEYAVPDGALLRVVVHVIDDDAAGAGADADADTDADTDADAAKASTDDAKAEGCTFGSGNDGSLEMMIDVAEQRRIEEDIRQANIVANLEAALEYHPESFGSVHMLYVPVTINGVEVQAFVDCGAQTTIMTGACAERCGVGRLIDKRWQGTVQGVGTGKIAGRVHAAQVIIGGLHLACSLTIIESGSPGAGAGGAGGGGGGAAVLSGGMPDMLLGLDMLRRHQVCIDLLSNALVIHGKKIPFLAESQISVKQ